MPEQKRHALSWDAEQYSHTLIAPPSGSRPSAVQVQKFLAVIIDQEVVPDNPSITLRAPTGEFREYPFVDPLTGQNLKVEIKNQKALNSVDEVASATEALRDYELEVAGVGKPKLKPLFVNFDEPYHLGVTCNVYSSPRSTSDLHESSAGNFKAIPYGEICTEHPDRGYFTNPYTSEVIEVRGAGCASFWIRFELGKFMFPEFTNNSLELLNPQVVALARSVFQMEFVQGCYW
ncbi:MAG: hypothetical protein U1F83_01755 [Verrucomicrobiota bacterium]